jgi:sialate O-acetylesterase
MRTTLSRCVWLLAAGALLFAVPQQGAPPLPFVSPIFGDHMVLQRGKPNAIWGWSTPGDKVRIELAERSATAVAGTDGRWQAHIEPPAAGGTYTRRIAGQQQAVEWTDVLVGDVCICAGQSNMQFGLGQARNGGEEVKRADYPQIRYSVVGQRAAYAPVAVPRGSWRAVSPGTVGGRGGGISAVAYFFGRRLQEDSHIPIGLVHEAVGGVLAETFTSPEALRPLKDFDDGIAEVERRRQKADPEYGNYIMHWLDEYDIGAKTTSWADPARDDSSWKTVRLPGGFKELGVDEVPNVSWFRREIRLPDTLPEGMARLYLGSIDKMDTAYINGRQVGASSWVENPRVYFANGVPGERLALCALAEHYGRDVPHSGPTLKSVALLPGALKLHFDHIDGGLVVKGEKPAEFAIAGDDRKWYWANARIEGDTVVVWSPSVSDPKAVRYAWQANPAATLFNGAGLPAVPFRTDHWPGITAGRTRHDF